MATSYEDINRQHLRERLFGETEIRKLLSERSRYISPKIKEFKSLKNAERLEPHLKPHGGPKYRTNSIDTDKQRQSILRDVDDWKTTINNKIDQHVKEIYKDQGLDDEYEQIQTCGIQDLIDEETKIQSAHHPVSDLTNKEIEDFLKDNGFERDKHQDIERTSVAEQFIDNKREALLRTLHERDEEIRRETNSEKDQEKSKEVDRDKDR